MQELTSTLPAWAFYAVAGTGGAAITAAVIWTGARHHSPPDAPRPSARASRGDLAAAAIATAVSAEGMWETFGGMGLPPLLRVGTFTFIEIMVVQSARRARQSMTDGYGPGIDGVAMWVLTCLSAVLSASHEITTDRPNPAIVMVRLVAPLIAAWGWERNMRLERRRRGLSAGITWRITVERLLIRLGVAEPGERTAADVNAHRRVAALARGAKRARRLQETRAARWRQRRAMARVDRLYEAAEEHARLSTDAGLQRQLIAQVGALYNTDSLVRLTARPWWTPPDAEDEEPPADSDGTGPSAASVSLLKRLPERHTDGRGDIRTAHRTATHTVDRTDVRTAPPLTLPSVRPLPVRPAPAGLAWLDRADTPRAAAGVRAVRVPFAQPVWPLNPIQPTEPPARPRTRRAEKAAHAQKASKSTRKPKSYWVAKLAEEIGAEADEGRTWEPAYGGPDGLIARTGYGQSWCEKTVRAARQRANELSAARTPAVSADAGTADGLISRTPADASRAPRT